MKRAEIAREGRILLPTCRPALKDWPISPLRRECPLKRAKHPLTELSAADLDTDGDVDLHDFAIFMRIFGAGPGVRYVWDADNRLVEVVPGMAADGSRDAKVKFAYDHLGRRVRKQVYAWNGNMGVWTGPTKDVKYVYDGWRVIMELDGLNNDAITRKYTWGLDLSGSLEGAGGIGGLLAAVDTAGTTAPGDDRTFICTHDANGNVAQVIETTTPGGAGYGDVAAHYEYTLYGQRLNAPAAGEYDQPYRFSTKPFDAETGLGYWGYRYYSPDFGRWMSRDPIGERGGPNLYNYVSNEPTFAIDPNGLSGEDIYYEFRALYPDVPLPRGSQATNPASGGPLWDKWDDFYRDMKSSHKYTAQELRNAREFMKKEITAYNKSFRGKGGMRGGSMGVFGAAVVVLLTNPSVAYAPTIDIPYWKTMDSCDKVHCVCSLTTTTWITPPFIDLFNDDEIEWTKGPVVDYGMMTASECQSKEWFAPPGDHSWFDGGSSWGYSLYWRESYECWAK